MSVTADMSLMDILFDRDDPVLKFVDDRDGIKQEFESIDPKTETINDKFENWNADPDNLLQDFLNDEQFDFFDKSMNEYPNSEFDIAVSDWDPNSVDNNDIKDTNFGPGTFSDSGMSSNLVSPDLQNEHDFKPLDDDEQFSAVSGISNTSVHQLSKGDIKHEPQDLDYDPIEDEQASLGIIADEPSNVNFHKKKVHQVINVAPMAQSNPRSILLPVSTSNGIRTYKIIRNGNGRKTLKAIGSIGNNSSMVLKTIRPMGVPLVVKNFRTNVLNKRGKIKQSKILHHETTDDEEVTILSDSDDDKSKSQYPKLILSPEEKKLIQKEGVSLPTHYPLTKFEERELKRIRRKIRNKISAQDSRKRKKEYLDGLEDRVKQCTEENLSLVKKIRILQSQNQSLMAQLKKLQISLARSTTKTAQPATCLMVLMLSVALVMAPNLRLSQSNEGDVSEKDVSDNSVAPIGGRSRSLLSKPNAPDDCAGTDDEDKMSQEIQDLLRFHKSPSFSETHSYSDMKLTDPDMRMGTLERSRKSSYRSLSSGYDSPPDFLLDHDYDPPPLKKSRFNIDDKVIKSFGDKVIKDFIIPEVDDVWPIPQAESMKPKQYIIPDVDDEWVASKSFLTNTMEDLTTEVKVNISDAKGTRTVLIKVPKENK